MAYLPIKYNDSPKPINSIKSNFDRVKQLAMMLGGGITPGYNNVIGNYGFYNENPQLYRGIGTNPTYLLRTRYAQYNLGWDCYHNKVFETILSQYIVDNRLVGPSGKPLFYPWKLYLASRGLYARTMPVFNPVTRLVDFYASHIYPGVLSEDGKNLPDGMRIAVPISKDTSTEFKSAIAQLWNWSNWQKNQSQWIRFCAMAGDGPVEIVDDVPNGRIILKPIWPGYVLNVDLNEDGTGEVETYTVKYGAFDQDNQEIYQFSKIITKDKIATFKNGNPFSYNENPAEYDNPYGFVPVVWNKHRDLGIMPGNTAIRNWNKVEKYCSLASRIHRYLERQAKSPMLISGNGKLKKVDGLKAGNEEELNLFQVDGEVHVHPLTGNMDLPMAFKYLSDLQQEIIDDHSEIELYKALRAMSQLTGPAAEQMMGDVGGYLNDARAGYDTASIRLYQMASMIGGMRYKEGKEGWSNRTVHQKKFQNFDLDSYDKGDLDMAILPRPIIPSSRAQEALSMTTVYNKYKAGQDAGIPLNQQQIEDEGKTLEEVQQLYKYQDDDKTPEYLNKAALLKQPQLDPSTKDAQIDKGEEQTSVASD